LRSSIGWFVTVLALIANASSGRADAPEVKPEAKGEPEIKVEATEGTALSKKDEAAVRRVLGDYMLALQKKDYRKAGEMLDRASLLAAVDPMLATISADSTHLDAARRKIFGVSTRDSIEQRGNGPLFTSLMAYMMGANPNAADVLARASIQVLAARRMGDRVHIAYQVTLPASEPGGMPYEQITAQQMRKVDGKWRILFQLDQ
jgi:hypothetical protein